MFARGMKATTQGYYYLTLRVNNYSLWITKILINTILKLYYWLKLRKKKKKKEKERAST